MRDIQGYTINLTLTTWTGPGTVRHHLEELYSFPQYLERDQLRGRVQKNVTVVHHRKEDGEWRGLPSMCEVELCSACSPIFSIALKYTSAALDNAVKRREGR